MSVNINQGLKPYQEAITHEIGSLKTIVNLCPSASNILVEIPLFKTFGASVMSPSLIYNYLLRGSGGYIKGAKFIYFPTLSKEGNTFYITNPDGTVDSYNGYNTINPETNSYIYYSYAGIDYYILKDKYDNKIEYLDYNYSLPYRIIYKDGTTLTITSSSNIPSKISNSCGDEILFIYNGSYISQIHYKKNNTILYKAYLGLTNNKLSSVNIKKVVGSDETIIAHYTITESSNTLSVKDEILNYSYTYTFNNDNQITSFHDSYYPAKITNISYSATTTTVTDIFGKVTKYYFSNGLPTMIYDDLGVMHEKRYDYLTKKIKEENQYPLLNPKPNLLPVNMNGFNISNAFFITSYSETDSNYSFITNKYKITGNNGSAYYEINSSGSYNDTIQFLFYIKVLSGGTSNYLHVQMMIGDTQATRNIDLNYTEGYKLVSLELTAKKDFTHIYLEFIGYGIVAVVGGLTVIRNTGLKTYTYTNSNLTNYESKYHKQDMNYDNNLISSNTGTNLPSTNYSYDNRGNITKEEKPYLMDINNTYNVYNQPLTKELKDKDSNKIKEEYVYDDNHLLQTKKDSLLNETTYSYDSFGNIETITNPLNQIVSYTYDSKSNIATISRDNKSITYGYDNSNKLTSLAISNGNTYEFSYLNGNLESVSINNEALGEYSYDTYGRISSSSYGFSFEYSLDKLTTIKFNNSIIYSIEYDSKNRIEEIKNSTNQTLEEYIYDDEDKLEEKNIRELNIRYDYSDSEVGATLYTLGNKQIYQSYNSINKSFNTSKEAILHQFEKECYIGEYRENYKLKYKNTLMLPNDTFTFARFIDDYIPYIKPESNLSYTTSDKIMIGFWFKQDYPYFSYIFSMNQNNVFIGVYVDSSNYLHMMIENNNQTTYITSTSQINLSNWNYFGLEYYDNGNERKIIFELNEEVRKDNVTFSLTAPYTYHIGYKYYNNTKTGVFPGGISNLMLGKDNVSEGYTYLYYSFTKNYIYSNRLEEFQNIPYISTSSFQDVSNLNYDYIPLENNLKSKNEIEPYRFDVNQDMFYDASKTFSYNLQYKRYCYLAYGNKLAYDFNFTNNGTIFMKGSILESKDKQYFLSIKNDFGVSISLYRNQNKHIILKYSYYEIDTGYSIISGAFSIGISYNEITYNSNRAITVFVGNNTITQSLPLGSTFTNTKVYLGTDSEGNNALMGMVLDVYYKREYNTSIPSSISSIEEYHKNHYYDSFGRMDQYILYKNNTELLNDTYSFKTRSDDTYTSLQVKKETFKINNTNYERNYTLDSLGRVTSITDTTFGSHTYTYNSLGYLSTDDNKSLTYDSNGNITDYGTNHYVYDNLSRLVSYNNNPITYNSTHPFLMKTYNGYEYSYQGKRLVSVSKDDKRINYTYDLEGLIIKKRVTIVEGDLPVSTTTTNYYYDNRKLVKEVCGNTTISYFYDSNNQLYGYKKNSTVYFYIRDVLGNIIGILNNNGVIVSKFDYDAFGNIINQTGSVISNFRYKGYYYDTDIELYYLKSRFYNPILLRFITPDSIEYLDSSSIIGLNLYAYCGNDPINMKDEEGNSCIFAIALIVVGICFIVSTTFAIDNTFIHPADKDYYKDDDSVLKGELDGDTLSNGKSFKYSIIGNKSNPNKTELKILNSSTYSISELDEMIDIIMEKADNGELINKRKVLNELKWHKIGYNFGYNPDETASADVYFNADDEGHGFFSWIMNNIYI